MEFILKVSPKGQVTLPKRLREALKVKDIVEIDIEKHRGIVRKPEEVTGALAGCFSGYAAKKKISLKKAVEKALHSAAHEIAAKTD